jgi:hypothetical protein
MDVSSCSLLRRNIKRLRNSIQLLKRYSTSEKLRQLVDSYPQESNEWRPVVQIDNADTDELLTPEEAEEFNAEMIRIQHANVRSRKQQIKHLICKRRLLRQMRQEIAKPSSSDLHE